MHLNLHKHTKNYFLDDLRFLRFFLPPLIGPPLIGPPLIGPPLIGLVVVVVSLLLSVSLTVSLTISCGFDENHDGVNDENDGNENRDLTGSPGLPCAGVANGFHPPRIVLRLLLLRLECVLRLVIILYNTSINKH